MTTFAGASSVGATDGSGSTARFHRPEGLALDTADNLYIASGSVIRKAQPTAPVLTQHPASTTVTAGTSVTFTTAASGVPLPTFQWYLDNRPVCGGTAARLALNSVSTAEAGTYTVVATKVLGATTSQSATLAVTAPPAPSSAGSSGGGAASWGAARALAAALGAHTFRSSRNPRAE